MTRRLTCRGAARRAPTAVALLLLAAALAVALASACGGDSMPAPTPGTIIQGNAVQIFLKEAYKVGWFTPDDNIQVESEPLLYQQALDKASAINLSFYPTIPGTPPYADGLPGWLIIARGDFFDIPDGATPNASTSRRPAVAAAFVDTHGGLAYSMRFTDIPPTPQPPKETLPPESPSG